MASQAWEQFKSSRITRTTLIGLIAGILVGLTLGLLIGWVWWPVEYKEPAAPAALTAPTSSGLPGASADAVALYMGATADAFAFATRAGDTEAAAAAAQRLAALGGTVADNFDTAIAFYDAQANGAATAANLRDLAAAVGVTVGASTAASGAAPSTESGASAAGAPAPTATEAAASESGGGWGLGNFLAALIAAGLLMAGGAYIFYTLRKQGTLGSGGTTTGFSEETAPGFNDEPASGMSASGMSASGMSNSTATFTRDNLTPPPGTAATVTTTAWPRQAQPGVAGGFDNEAEEDDTAPAVVHGHPSGGYGPLSESDLEPATDDEDVDADNEENGDEADDPWEQSPADPHSSSARTAAPGLVTAVGSTPPLSGPRTPAPDAVTGAPPIAKPAAAATLSTLQPPPPARVAGAKDIANVQATYAIGMDTFDFAEDIKDPNDPTGNTYIGEFGMVIPENKGMLNHDLSKTIAFDVWLFDKSDEKQIQTATRTLLSAYAHDKLYDDFQRQKPNLAPLVAQPGLNFQLEAQQLVLDCTVRNVVYTSDGIFKNLAVDLVVKRKA